MTNTRGTKLTRPEQGRAQDKTRRDKQERDCHKYLCEFWEQQCQRNNIDCDGWQSPRLWPKTQATAHTPAHTCDCLRHAAQRARTRGREIVAPSSHAADNEQQDTFAPAAARSPHAPARASAAASCLLSFLGFLPVVLCYCIPQPPSRRAANGWRAKVDTTPKPNIFFAACSCCSTDFQRRPSSSFKAHPPSASQIRLTQPVVRRPSTPIDCRTKGQSFRRRA